MEPYSRRGISAKVHNGLYFTVATKKSDPASKCQTIVDNKMKIERGRLLNLTNMSQKTRQAARQVYGNSLAHQAREDLAQSSVFTRNWVNDSQPCFGHTFAKTIWFTWLVASCEAIS